MNIYIYSDESGVFDNVHNDIFVFGGIILIGTDAKEEWSRRYAKAERDIRDSKKVGPHYELKATQVSNKEKGKLFRSLNNCYKFGVVIREKEILERIFASKKDKQRYLDYAYKIAVKKALLELIDRGIIIKEEVDRLYFYVDEHTTATNGRYELREGLEQELKNGTYNYKYSRFFPPVFSDLQELNLEFCNSKSKLLVRAADIVANRIFYHATKGDMRGLRKIKNLYISKLP